MAKPIAKSIRISEEVFKIVNTIDGEGFNDKFEKLVLDYKHTIPTRKAQLQSINQKIQKKKKELETLSALADKVRSMAGMLDQISILIPRTSELMNDIHTNATQELDQDRAAADQIEIQKSMGR